MGAFERLRGYRIKLAIRDTNITHFPPFVFNTFAHISFLALELTNNKLETLNPYSHTKPPIVNQHGTILERLNLQVKVFENCNNAIMQPKKASRHRSRIASNSSPLVDFLLTTTFTYDKLELR